MILGVINFVTASFRGYLVILAYSLEIIELKVVKLLESFLGGGEITPFWWTFSLGHS